ncbi:MAG: hypothetical protein O7G88_13700 [bacterium]|nr:hypothetical protein [bacterium]
MIASSVYKLLHIVGIIMIFLSLGGQINHAINGGSKDQNAWRKAAGITHGVGLFLVLLGGFGMLARLEIHWPWPGWIIGKVVVWLLLGGLVVVVNRKPGTGRGMWYIVIFLGLLAVYFATMKPF